MKQEFNNDELQKQYEEARKVSIEHLQKLDRISIDIRRLEEFLKQSGFGEYHKEYYDEYNNKVLLNWTGKRLCLENTNLIETKVMYRMKAYIFLPEFLKDISTMHLNLGVHDEAN